MLKKLLNFQLVNKIFFLVVILISAKFTIKILKNEIYNGLIKKIIKS